MLNEKQKEAVYTFDEKVLVVAGAGTGKTTVLTERILFLLKMGFSERNIFAFTFTNKAAKEMKERINKKLNRECKLNISTFHSYFYSVLRMFPEYVGYKKGIQIIDDDDKLLIIKRIIKENNITILDRDLVSYISKIKNHVPLNTLTLEQELMLNHVFIEYQEILKKLNKMDFDDILYYFKELLDTSAFIREMLQEEAEFILVDECQDTNKIQYEILKILSDHHKNLYFVGDPDQLIYTFRGSDISNINDFITNEKATIIKLEENYRSSECILNAANSVINKNTDRVDKKLYTNNKNNNIQVIYRSLNNNYDEAMYLRLLVEKLVNEGYKYSEMAVLYRNNYLSPLVEKELITSKIPFIIYGGYPFFRHKEIKTLISYYRFLYDTNDDLSFDYIINNPVRRLAQSELNKINDEAKKLNSSKYQIFLKLYPNFDIIHLVDELQYIWWTISPEDFINYLIDKLNYESFLKREINSKSKIYNLNQFKKMISELKIEGNVKEETIKFMDDIVLSLNQEEKGNDLKLMTIHQAKGLEFKIVFLIGANEGIIPPYKHDSKTLEEERRLFYVAITRAKERLFILSSKQRIINGIIKNYEPTRFINEIERKYLKII